MTERAITPDVLVVDDNDGNVALIRAVLQSQSFGVRAAGSAEAMRAALQAGRPDLILMDVQLPGTDGLALTRQLKSDPATRDIPIIILTALAMPEDQQKALSAGCDRYISKPFRPQELVAAVRGCLWKGEG